MLLRRALISKRMETRLLAVAIGQVVEVVFSESVGVVSGPSAKRWADSLRKSVGSSGLAEGLAWSVGARMTSRYHRKRTLRTGNAAGFHGYARTVRDRSALLAIWQRRSGSQHGVRREGSLRVV